MIVSAALATPLGEAIADVVARLRAGEIAARPNPLFDASRYRCTLAAPVREPLAKTPHDRILRRMGRCGYQVALRAVAGAAPLASGERLGLWVGVGGLRARWDEMMPALAEQTEDFADSWNRGLRNLHPFWMLRHLSNNAHALLSRDLDARGEGITFGGANADAQAVSAACDALETGTVDDAVVLAYDSLIDPESIASRDEVFVPGEAAAAVVLRRGESGAAISATTAADASSGRPQDPVIEAARARLGDGASYLDVTSVMGDLGGATALVAAICAHADPSVAGAQVCVSVGAPGLVGAIRVGHQ